LLIPAGNYKIKGNVKVPSGKTIKALPGSSILLTEPEKSYPYFELHGSLHEELKDVNLEGLNFKIQSQRPSTRSVISKIGNFIRVNNSDFIDIYDCLAIGVAHVSYSV
jgi:hypothetical protein